MEITTQTKLEEIAIKIDAHGKAAIENILTVGKLLCDARSEHGEDDRAFGQWRESRIPWMNRKIANLWMNAFRNNGDSLLGNNFTRTVIYQLTAPEVPESAREEAAEHDALTVKQSKDLTKANKRIEELKFECQRLAASTNPPPDLDNLIPEIDKLFRGGSIVLARAKRLSTLDHEHQNIYLQEFHSKEFHRKAADRAKSEAHQATRDAMNAIKEKETAIAKLKEISGTTDSNLISKHDKELTELRTGYLEMLREEKTKAQKEASELHAELNKEQIQRAHKEKLDAIKAKTQAQEKASAAHKAQGELESKIKRLEEQLEVNNPTNVDLAMEKQIQSVTNSVMFVMKQLRNDMLTIGGGMERSIRAAEGLMEEIANKLAELEGDSEEIIEIGV